VKPPIFPIGRYIRFCMAFILKYCACKQPTDGYFTLTVSLIILSL